MLSSNADLFLTEIHEQPEALRACIRHWLREEGAHSRIRELLRGRGYPLTIFTGMGSSIDACIPATVFLNGHGRRAVAIETSELLHFHPALRSSDLLLIVVTQSGESAEPVRLLGELEETPTFISLTNGLENFVARQSTLPLDIHAGKELTVSTKTYVATLAALYVLAHLLVDRDPTESVAELESAVKGVEQFLERYHAKIDPLVAVAQTCQHLSFIGRGPSLATAHESALIMKEAGHRLTEAISGGHFRHGPLEMVSDRHGYVLFPGEGPTRELTIRLGEDIARYGGRVVYVGAHPQQGTRGVWVPVESASPCLLPIVEIVPIQLLASTLASLEGRRIDGFEKLGKVTRTE